MVTVTPVLTSFVVKDDGTLQSESYGIPRGATLLAVSVDLNESGIIHAIIALDATGSSLYITLDKGWITRTGSSSLNIDQVDCLSWTGRMEMPTDYNPSIQINAVNQTGGNLNVAVSYLYIDPKRRD